MEFISYENPSEFKAGKKSRAVRSYVTKRQHRLKREAEHKVKSEDSRSADAEPEISDQIDPKPDEQGSTQQTKPRSRRRRKHAVALESSSPRLPPQVSQQLMLPWRSAFDTLESFIHATMVPTHVSALGLDSSETQLASQWFSSACVIEPALYTSALLSVAPLLRQVSPDLIFYLRSATITSLVEAFASEKRRQHPALILAVECLTFYECFFGDRNLAQKVHRPAMRKLIQAHGGRDGVDIPLSWKKLSVMADIVMEIQMGSEGESSFIMNEWHQNAGILEAEWTDALKMYFPDGEGELLAVRCRAGGETARLAIEGEGSERTSCESDVHQRGCSEPAAT